MKARVVVNAVIQKDGQILLGQKPKDVGPYPNTWRLPGGGAELEKESLVEAVRREIKEETDLEVANLKMTIFGEDNQPNKNDELIHYVFLDFTADYLSGEAKAGDDMAIVKWFSKEELKDINLSDPSIKLFKFLGLL